MAFNVLSKIEEKVSTNVKDVKNLMPGGKIPEAAALAELKGTIPNINSIKNVLGSKTFVPDQFLK